MAHLKITFNQTVMVEEREKDGRSPGRPGLVVMGGDSCPEGRRFESQHGILDGHFVTYICCGNCNVCLKRRQ